MLKKTIAALCALLLIVSLSLTAFAAGGPAAAAGGQSGTGAPETAGSAGAFTAEQRQQLTALNTQIRANRLQIRELSLQNAQIREQCRLRIEEIRAAGEPLSEDQLATLAQLRTQLQSQTALLAGTRGDIADMTPQMRMNRLQGDFDALAENLNAVIAVQQSRIGTMQQINAQLQSMCAELG
jgi:TolA-binding protein